MTQDTWLSIEEVCVLTGEVKETVRRKCKRGEYSCTFEKNGKYKNYLVNLDSLLEAAKNKYFGIKRKKNFRRMKLNEQGNIQKK